MLNNGLKLNDDKTEFLIIGTSQQLGKLDNINIRVELNWNWTLCREHIYLMKPQ